MSTTPNSKLWLTPIEYKIRLCLPIANQVSAAVQQIIPALAHLIAQYALDGPDVEKFWFANQTVANRLIYFNPYSSALQSLTPTDIAQLSKQLTF